MILETTEGDCLKVLNLCAFDQCYMKVWRRLNICAFFREWDQLLSSEVFAESDITPVQFRMLSSVKFDDSLVDFI